MAAGARVGTESREACAAPQEYCHRSMPLKSNADTVHSPRSHRAIRSTSCDLCFSRTTSYLCLRIYTLTSKQLDPAIASSDYRGKRASRRCVPSKHLSRLATLGAARTRTCGCSASKRHWRHSSEFRCDRHALSFVDPGVRSQGCVYQRLRARED